MSTSTVTIEILDVAPEAARLRVRVARYHERANLPLNRSFFVRMFSSLAVERGGNPAIAAALEGKELDEAFVDTNTWRFIAGYTEEPGATDDERVYEVTVTDPAWLSGLEPGYQTDTTDYSTWPDEVTAEEAATIPPLRHWLRCDLEAPEVWSVDVSSTGRLLAVLGEEPGGIEVFDTATWERVSRVPDPGRVWEVRFAPGTTCLVPHPGDEAFDALTGATLDREEALGGWKPEGDLEGKLWFATSADGTRRVVLTDSGAAITDARGHVLRTVPAWDFACLSRDGRVFLSSEMAELKIWRLDTDGPPETIPVRDRCGGVALSPDGAYALTTEGEHRHIYVRRLSDGEVVRYGTPWSERHGKRPHLPLWPHDGRFVTLCHYTQKPRAAWLEVHRLEKPEARTKAS